MVSSKGRRGYDDELNRLRSQIYLIVEESVIWLHCFLGNGLLCAYPSCMIIRNYFNGHAGNHKSFANHFIYNRAYLVI